MKQDEGKPRGVLSDECNGGRNNARRGSTPGDALEAEHVTERIQALVAGRLAAAEIEAARTHCHTCAPCRDAWQEVEGVWGALAAENDPTLPRPLWPLVRERIAGAVGHARLVLRLSGAAAVALGIVVGIVLGSSLVRPQARWQEQTWAEVGTLLADDHDATLGDMYLSMAEGGGDEQ